MKICPQCGTEYSGDVRFCPNDGATLRAKKSDGDLIGQVVADRYLIQRKLGEGGMGQVYLAEHVRMKRKSAVKVMSPKLAQDADAIQRFNREASNACQIAHPNVAAVYDFGETEEGLIYLAMEYIEGEPLTNIVRRHGALPPGRAADITRQTADGLAAAHELGIVHRDLKPDNIMVAKRRDGTDFVKVVDFGIAKAIQADDQKVTKTGLAVGTPEYMSPEQLAGDRLDARTDIYSLGLVSFAMFTGQLPFPAVTSKEAMIMRLTERPRTLAQIRPDVEWPAELQRVFDRALANDARDRYQEVAEFGRDVARAVEHMPRGTAAADAGTVAIPHIDTPRPSQPGTVTPPAPAATPATPAAPLSPSPTVPYGSTVPPLPVAPAAGAAAAKGDTAPAERGIARPSAATMMIQTPDPVPVERPPAPVARELPPDVATHQLAATGMMPAHRPPPRPAATPLPEPEPMAPARRPRGFVFVMLVLVPVIAAGAFLVLRPKTANPPAASESTALPPAATTPAPDATPSSPATGAATPAAPVSSGAAPAGAAPTPAVTTAPAAPVVRWADTLAPIQRDIAAARTRFEDSDYVGAVTLLQAALARVDGVIARRPDARGATALRGRITRQIADVRTACEADAQTARRRGRVAPTCP